MQSKNAGVIFSSVTAHTFKGLAFDSNTTSLMAKITIYGYRPGKEPNDYRPIHSIWNDAVLPSTLLGDNFGNTDNNYICNATKFFFVTTNNSHKLSSNLLYMKFVCLMAIIWAFNL